MMSPSKSKHQEPSASKESITIGPPVTEKYVEVFWKQVAAISFWISIVPGFFLTNVILLLAAFVWPVQVLTFLVIYHTWVYMYDYKCEEVGGYGENWLSEWHYRGSHWYHFRSYFDARLIKTVDLPADKNYIFGIHPHGVYCLALFANILSGPEFPKLFPGISTYASTLPINFRLPFWREFILRAKMISVDRKSLEYVLNTGEVGSYAREGKSPKNLRPSPNKTPGSRAVVIAVGGGDEYLHMEPGTMDLVILKRKGFAKLALTTGSPLVPILSFGENELYERINTPSVKALTKFTQRVGHFAFPAFKGRFFTFPRKAQLVTIVGAPIPVEKVENPTAEQVDALHAKYLEQLQGLYEQHKDQYFSYRKQDMRFVK